MEEWLARAATVPPEVEGAGGAPTNVALAWTGLGGRAVIIGPVAGDAYGARVRADLARHRVELVAVDPPPRRQAHSLAFARDGGERLFLATLPELTGPLHCDDGRWAGPGWLVTSAYELHDPALADLVARGCGCAAAGGRRLVLDLADPNFVRRHRAGLRRIVGLGLDVLLAGPEALAALTGLDEAGPLPATAIAPLARTVLITQGAGGVRLVADGADRHFPAEPATPVDTTGAGDAFLGAFLAARARGWNDEAAARFALAAAARAITVIGAHLPESAWRELALRLEAGGC